MDRIVFSAMCTLVHVPSMCIRYAPFSEVIVHKRKRALFTVYLVILGLIAAGYYFFGENHTYLSHKILLLLGAAALSAANVIFIPGYWREHLFTAGLASLHVSATFYLCAFAVMRFVSVRSPIAIVSIGASATFVLFVLIAKLYINSARRVVTPFLNIDSGDYWKRIWFLPLLLFLASFFSMPLNTYNDDIYSILNRIMILAATVLLCNAIAEDHKHMVHRLKLAEQLGIQREYTEHLAEHVFEARKSRHDFKHHLAVIRRYIDTDDKSGLKEYWEDLNNIVSKEFQIPYTGNAALDGILYRYAVASKENDIKFNVSGTVSKIIIPDMEFSVLIGNALENAFAGCMTVESDRYITIQLRTDHEEQLIMISNSFDGVIEKDGEEILSRKRDKEPGLGLESIRSICDKYECISDIRYADNNFFILLLIKLHPDNKQKEAP